MSWFNIYNRPVFAAIVAGGAAFGGAMGDEPPIWIAVTAVLGFGLGWFTTPRKKDA